MPKNFKKYILFFAIIFIFLIIGHTVFALENNYPLIPGAPNINTDQSLPNLIAYFFYLALAIAGILGVLSIVISGILLLVSAGSPGAANVAKERIFGSILGIVLLLFSVTLLSTINPKLIDPNQPALVSTLPKGPVLIDSSNNGIVAPYIARKTSNLPAGFDTLLNNCAIGPDLLVWKYPVPDIDDTSAATVTAVPCGEKLSMVGAASFKIAQKTPGIYLFKGQNCTGNATEVITYSGTLPDAFQRKIVSALIVNDIDKDSVNYGFVLAENPNLGGACSVPFNNFDIPDKCIPVGIEGTCSSNGGDDNGGTGKSYCNDKQQCVSNGDPTKKECDKKKDDPSTGTNSDCPAPTGSCDTSNQKCVTSGGNPSYPCDISKVNADGTSNQCPAPFCDPDTNQCVALQICDPASGKDCTKCNPTNINQDGSNKDCSTYFCTADNKCTNYPANDPCDPETEICDKCDPAQNSADCATAHCTTIGAPGTYTCSANGDGKECTFGPGADASCNSTVSRFYCKTDGSHQCVSDGTGNPELGICDPSDPNKCGGRINFGTCDTTTGTPKCGYFGNTGTSCNINGPDTCAYGCNSQNQCVAGGTGGKGGDCGGSSTYCGGAQGKCDGDVCKFDSTGTGVPCSDNTICGGTIANGGCTAGKCISENRGSQDGDCGSDAGCNTGWCNPVSKKCEPTDNGGIECSGDGECTSGSGGCVGTNKCSATSNGPLCSASTGCNPSGHCVAGACIQGAGGVGATSCTNQSTCRVIQTGFSCNPNNNTCEKGNTNGGVACNSGDNSVCGFYCSPLAGGGYACKPKNPNSTTSCNPNNIDGKGNNADCQNSFHTVCQANGATPVCMLTTGPGADQCIGFQQCPILKCPNGAVYMPDKNSCCAIDPTTLLPGNNCVPAAVVNPPPIGAFNYNSPPLASFLGIKPFSTPNNTTRDDVTTYQPENITLASITNGFNNIQLVIGPGGTKCESTGDCATGETCKGGRCAPEGGDTSGGTTGGTCPSPTTSIYVIRGLNPLSEISSNQGYAGDGVSIYEDGGPAQKGQPRKGGQRFEGPVYEDLNRTMIGQQFTYTSPDDILKNADLDPVLSPGYGEDDGATGTDTCLDGTGGYPCTNTIDFRNGNFLMVLQSQNENKTNQVCGFFDRKIDDLANEEILSNGKKIFRMDIFPIVP